MAEKEPPRNVIASMCIVGGDLEHLEIDIRVRGQREWQYFKSIKIPYQLGTQIDLVEDYAAVWVDGGDNGKHYLFASYWEDDRDNSEDITIFDWHDSGLSWDEWCDLQNKNDGD